MGQNSGLLSSLTDWNSTLAGYADSISSGVVMPIALTVLALFMVLELYNFTQTIAMNGASTAFTIQQVALVMLKITLCRWAVLHSTEILNAMFEVAAMVTNGIAGYVGSGQVNSEVDIENAISALPGGIGNMPVAMELMVVSWMLRLVNIVINTIVAARFIELYVYNALASLPIATLCYRELHGIAVNFLKNYMAVALQGAVLYLVIGFYPALTASLGSGGDITEQAWAMLGKSVILLVAVFMSGRFTKAITSAIQWRSSPMLSTKTNLEITEYHEKFFFGLSLRQLACFGVAAVLAIATCFVCLQWLQLDIQLVSYIVMVEVLPFLGLGFISHNGYPFEKLVKIYWAWYCGPAEVAVCPRQEKNYVFTKKARRLAHRTECVGVFARTGEIVKTRKKESRQRTAAARKTVKERRKACKKAHYRTQSATESQ